MRPAPLLLAELAKRDLDTESRKIARRHHVTLEEVCERTHRAEVVKARHAIWAWQLHELGTVSAVCRIWGVDRSAMLAADIHAKSPIAFVLLDTLKAEGISYRFAFFSGRPKPFAIQSLSQPLGAPVRSEWFETYESARRVWTQLQELAEPSFRSVSAGAPVPQLAEGGR